MPTNDNDPVSRQPDSHGSAALLLVESLLHELCGKGALLTSEAIEIVERAADVQRDHAEAADGDGAASWQSHALLSAIAASLHTEADRPSGPPHPAI